MNEERGAGNEERGIQNTDCSLDCRLRNADDIHHFIHRSSFIVL
jgi:hypothetical protein